MVTSTLVDLVQVVILSTGSGALALGSATPAHRGVEALTDGLSYSYSIQQGGTFEVGQGVYTASGHTLTRTPNASSNGGFPVNLQAGAVVSFTLRAEDVVPSGGGGTGAFRAWLRAIDPPGAAMSMDLWEFQTPVLFPVDFDQNSGFTRGNAPAGSYVITVWRYAVASSSKVQVATLTLHPDRTVTRDTSGVQILVSAGQALEFIASGTPDVATKFCEQFVGVYQ